MAQPLEEGCVSSSETLVALSLPEVRTGRPTTLEAHEVTLRLHIEQPDHTPLNTLRERARKSGDYFTRC